VETRRGPACARSRPSPNGSGFLLTACRLPSYPSVLRVRRWSARILYAILCYNDEDVVGSWTKEEDDAVMGRPHLVHRGLEGRRKLGPSARLLPTTAATTLRKSQDLVIDGPYAETKEQPLGFYVVDVAGLEEGLEVAQDLARANSGGAYELRPIFMFLPGSGVA
jgi:hypothetical protein